MCSLNHDKNNHKSASEFSEHVDKYIAEEKALGAIIGPDQPPIKNLHYFPLHDQANFRLKLAKGGVSQC